MASTPEPQPRSANEPEGSSSSISSRRIRVVGCEPVPKAWPGSITRSSASGCGSDHGGRTHTRPPTRTGSWKSRQRSAQSPATSSPRTVTSVPRHVSLPVGERGQLTGGTVDRVLHPALAVHLLYARGGELERMGQHGLGRLGGRPKGEPDQRNARLTLARIDSCGDLGRRSGVGEASRLSSDQQLALARVSGCAARRR